MQNILAAISANTSPTLRWRTRFAPSPTGYLHLGHVVHALYVWGIARLAGAEVLFRIEDHDRQRCRPEYERALLEDMAWLGLIPDVPTGDEFAAGACAYRQSDCDAIYAAVAARLTEDGLLYGCDCSRARVQARTGQCDGETRYDGHCRDRGMPLGSDHGWRVRISPGIETFYDILSGRECAQEPEQQCGDLLIRDRYGQWTYQFCVVVDDLRHGVNLIVRGADLLESTGRQLRLARYLGCTVPPLMAHHALLVDGMGNKLSKRDFAAPIRGLRESGTTAEQVLGMAAAAAGIRAREERFRAAEIPDLMSSNLAICTAISSLRWTDPA